MKKFILMLLFWGTILPITAQQIVTNEDFEIRLPEGWKYSCKGEKGVLQHSFQKDSVSYIVNVFAVSVYTDQVYEDYLPLGTMYVDSDEELGFLLEDGIAVECKQVQGDDANPKVSGYVYVTNRNDKTIVIQEVNRNNSLYAKGDLLEQIRWAEIPSLSLSERVDKFCNVLNELVKEFDFIDAGICFKQSAKRKKLIIEYHIQNPEDETKRLAKGKLKKKDVLVSELLFGTLPIFLEMGYEGYTFQLSRYLMNGKLESKVVYKPKDYKHLLERKKQYASFTLRLVDDDEQDEFCSFFGVR